jgi:hypothetical protein
VANEGRAKAAADAETQRKDAYAKLEIRVAEAEKAINQLDFVGLCGGGNPSSRACFSARLK